MTSSTSGDLSDTDLSAATSVIVGSCSQSVTAQRTSNGRPHYSDHLECPANRRDPSTRYTEEDITSNTKSNTLPAACLPEIKDTVVQQRDVLPPPSSATPVAHFPTSETESRSRTTPEILNMAVEDPLRLVDVATSNESDEHTNRAVESDVRRTTACVSVTAATALTVDVDLPHTQTGTGSSFETRQQSLSVETTAEHDAPTYSRSETDESQFGTDDDDDDDGSPVDHDPAGKYQLIA